MWNGAKLSLEIDAGQVRLYVRPAGASETLLAAVPGSKGSPQTWTHLQGDRLILVVTPYEMGPGGRVHRIDLKTGKVTELGPIVGLPFARTWQSHRMAATSPSSWRFGPIWSPDGKALAVTSGVVKGIGEGEGGGSEFAPKTIWLIEADTGAWTRVQDLADGESLQDWKQVKR